VNQTETTDDISVPELVADSKRKGQIMPILDSMIAATALTHGLTVATHDVRGFQKAGVPVLDPFV